MADERIKQAYDRMWKRMGELIQEGEKLDARGIGWAITIMEDVFPELLDTEAEGSEG